MVVELALAVATVVMVGLLSRSKAVPLLADGSLETGPSDWDLPKGLLVFLEPKADF